MFDFFLRSYRSGLLTFCGIEVVVENIVNEISGKEGFRRYDDGFYKNSKILSRHSNVLRGVIIGKKSWGLWIDQWSDGISECSFTLEEILKEFEIRNITIPESLMKDFHNRILKKKIKRNEIELERLRK